MQQLNDNFLLFAPKILDARYTNNGVPYVSVQEAVNVLSTSQRALGLTVLIGTGINMEYWWKDGISNNDLVIKEQVIGGGGGGGGVSGMINSSTNGVSISWNNPSTIPSATITLGSITPAAILSPGTITGSNLTGVNTGDETAVSIRTKIGPATSSNNGYLTSTDWNTFNGKQSPLISGTNIKTVNGASIIGSGDLVVTSSINDNTASTSSIYSSSKVTTLLSAKQDILVSGSSVKTINGSSILGSGNLVAGVSIDDTAATSTTVYSSSRMTALLGAKQNTLASGSTIKTINGGSILGGGDLSLAAINDTTSSSASVYSSTKTDSLLTGKANTVHSHSATDIITDSAHLFVTSTQLNTYNAKQDALVSGTSIKTINGVSILGSGDLPVSRTVTTVTNSTPQTAVAPGTFVDKIVVITASTITLSMGSTSGGTDLFNAVICDPPYTVISNDLYFISATTLYFTGMGSSTIKLYKQ